MSKLPHWSQLRFLLVSESALLLIFGMFGSDSTSLASWLCFSLWANHGGPANHGSHSCCVLCGKQIVVIRVAKVHRWSLLYRPPGPDFTQERLVAMVILEYFCLCRLSLLSVTSRMFSTPWFMMARWRTLWRLGVAGLKARMAGCTACWSPWSPPQDWWECPVVFVLWVKPLFSTLLACVSCE